MPLHKCSIMLWIGTILVVLWTKQTCGTLIARPPTPFGHGPVASYGGGYGAGFGGEFPIGIHSAGAGGAAIVFPKPTDRKSAFFGLLKLPYILCYYAAHGQWPQHPPQLNGAILDLGRHVFAMDDYGVRNYCSKHVHVTGVHRPCCSAPGIYPGAQIPYNFGGVGLNDPKSSKPGVKKPTPAPGEIDTEVITGIEDNGGGEEEGEEEAGGEEEGGEEEGGEEEEEAGRLQLPKRKIRKLKQTLKKGRCGNDTASAVKDCTPDTVPFVPLRPSMVPKKQAVKNQLTTLKPSVVEGKIPK